MVIVVSRTTSFLSWIRLNRNKPGSSHLQASQWLRYFMFKQEYRCNGESGQVRLAPTDSSCDTTWVEGERSREAIFPICPCPKSLPSCPWRLCFREIERAENQSISPPAKMSQSRCSHLISSPSVINQTRICSLKWAFLPFHRRCKSQSRGRGIYPAPTPFRIIRQRTAPSHTLLGARKVTPVATMKEKFGARICSFVPSPSSLKSPPHADMGRVMRDARLMWTCSVLGSVAVFPWSYPCASSNIVEWAPFPRNWLLPSGASLCGPVFCVPDNEP